MKKSIKIIFAVLTITMIISIATSVFATGAISPSEIKNNINIEDTDSIKDVGGRIVGIIQVVGTIVSVGMLIVLGIKYMMGSAEEKAEYKKTLFPYIIGAILIFAASQLAQVVYNWASAIKA